MKEAVVVHEFDFSKMVMAIQGKAFTTSQKIADYFGKSHKNVLRKIRQTISECPDDFARLNFEPADFIDKNGETQPMYKLTKDGYMLVVMGLTPAAAAVVLAKFWTGRRQKSRECRYSKPVNVAVVMGSPVLNQPMPTERFRCTFPNCTSHHGRATGNRSTKGWWICFIKESDRRRKNLRRLHIIDAIEAKGVNFLHDRVDFA